MMKKKKTEDEEIEGLVREARESWLKQKEIKKVRVKSLEELSETEEWVEVEFTEPVKVKSVLKKAVKH
ncbi:MAG: hypothetical protein QME59_04390 [Candidatus Hydrothermarchaeota archaeon]|nr:hypothetical protein [Candidatus Hydrothermarchaeota archaeon]